tara:strand:+ start:8849 stop:9211 length:363 start_codon:yes stop_codon:yes gene_type:complete
MAFEIITIVLAILILGVLLYTNYINERNVVRLLKEHYTSDEMQVCEISNLSFTEKLKYRVPFIPGMFVTTGLLSSFRIREKHYFKKLDIEFQDTEHIIYIDVQMKNNILINIDEFDTYSF